MLLVLLLRLQGGHRPSSAARLSRWWLRRLLRILHLRLRILGTPLPGPRLLVCNHVSWLDIPVIGAVELTRFVSKAEVRDWPLVGWLAYAPGTFYLKRGAGGTRELVAALAAHLPHGNVALFPEGTTSTGEHVLRFTPRLFAAAIEAGCPVQPVALRYGPAADGSRIAPFVGDDTLVSHLWRLLREPELEVELIFCAPLATAGAERAALAETARAAVAAAVEGRLSVACYPSQLAA
ncbi:MAG: 1-acyl-sn-glycerol-3-phosphate acyltransferase [Gammaproteobacteria bacterium]|nr:1-acyl-sn-glycerol-3-phosphate acyltransferase [Gammaproteobacteria bacterium]